jgi:ERCC4-related helicase/ERCC4-type nuclease/intein/homing endonuclease
MTSPLRQFQPRVYQETIFAQSLNKNTLVVLPTGLGKTAISMMLAVAKLKQHKDSKVIILAPTKPLVHQHLETFQKHINPQFLHEDEMIVFTGAIKAEKRQELWNDARIIFSTPQCVTGDTVIYSLKYGPISIQSFVEKHSLTEKEYDTGQGFEGISKEKILGFNNDKIEPVEISKVWKRTAKKTISINTELNKNIECTEEHPLLTINDHGDTEWKQARDLEKAQYVAVPSEITIPDQQQNLFSLFNKTKFNIQDRKYINTLLDIIKQKKLMPLSPYSQYRHTSMPLDIFLKLHKITKSKLPEKLFLTNKTGRSKIVTLSNTPSKELAYILGAMAGDGHIGDRSSAHGNKVVLSEIMYESIATTFIKNVKKCFNITPTSIKEKGIIYHNTCFAEVLNCLGIQKGKKTFTVRIPKYILSGPTEHIAHFLSGLFNADGDATKHMVRFATVSQNLAQDTQYALLRLGIISSLELRAPKMQKIGIRKINSSQVHIICITGRENLLKFLSICNPEKDKCQNLLVNLQNTTNPYTRSKNILPIPELLGTIYLENKQKIAKQNSSLTKSTFKTYRSREFLENFCKDLQSEGATKLQKLLNMPVRWVKIKQIKRNIDEKYVYDVTVPGCHNFIANQIINHNTIENDVLSKKMSLEDVSLIVFDEAHRATGDYSYVWLAHQYNKQAKNERILALTASPGTDEEVIDAVCTNLKIEHIEVKDRNSPDVKPYVKDVKIEWVEVDLPKPMLEAIKLIKDMVNQRAKTLEPLFGQINANIKYLKKTDLLKLQAYMQGMIGRNEGSSEIYTALSTCAQIMKLQHAQELLETQGVAAENMYMADMQEQGLKGKTKAAQNIISDPNFRTALIKVHKLSEDKIEHPKTHKVVDTLNYMFDLKKDTKIIIFNNYRDSISSLHKHILKHCDTNVIKPEIFVGQAKKKGMGLTQKKQLEVIKDFKAGVHNVLIMSSVGEEGLDIPAVDMVLFYEPVPSAIRQIQRAGRTGRQETGLVTILVAKGTRDVAYLYSTKNKTKKMYEVLDNAQKYYARQQAKDPVKSKPPVVISSTQRTLFDVQKETPKEEIKTYVPKIVVDSREKSNRIIKQLMDKGVDIELKQLTYGDYILSEEIGVEFKTKKDFVDSLLDGRMFEQASALARNFTKPLYVVQGEEDLFSIRNVNSKAILGALASIATSFRIPVIFTKDTEETSDLFYSILKKQDRKFEVNQHAHKPKDGKDLQEYIVGGLPNIGPTVAKSLLKHFETIQNITNASIDDLSQVDMMGAVKAKGIYDIVRKIYLP